MNLSERLQSLYQQFGELPGVTIELHKEIIAIAIQNAQASATVFLQGAQLSQYQPKGQQPVIWCSPDCDYRQGQPLRGGIPICWPWFGQFDKNPETIRKQFNSTEPLVAHGLVRQEDWQLDSIDASDSDITVLKLSLLSNSTPSSPSSSSSNSSPRPFQGKLQLTLSIGTELDCQLTITNQGSTAFSFTAALHSYLSISDCSNVSIEGLDTCQYIDTVEDPTGASWTECQQQGDIVVDQEIDRIYSPAPTQTQLVDQGWSRRIILNSTGSRSTVVWNPWQEKAKHLSCFDNQAYRQMVCIETANVMADSIELQSGQTHQLGVRITAETISD